METSQLAGHFTFNLDGSFEIDSDADITTNALVNGQINGTGSFSKAELEPLL